MFEAETFGPSLVQKLKCGGGWGGGGGHSIPQWLLSDPFTFQGELQSFDSKLVIASFDIEHF